MNWKKTRLVRMVALVCAMVLGAVANAETRYGLFVGINEYTQGANYLDGCDWDAMRMLDAYTTGGSAAPANCSLVASTAATKDVLRQRFRAMAAKAVSGDTVLYYHSGHGGDYDSDAGDDGAFLCATDADWYDYEFAEDLEAFAPGVNVVIVIDACYSGGMFKSAGKAGGGFPFAASVRRIMAKRQRQQKGNSGTANIGWITAADSDETSSMEGRGSEFTHRFLEGWQDASADEDDNGLVSFGELGDLAVEYVEQSSVQLSGRSVLNTVNAGSAFDVDEYRTLSFDGRFYGFFGECPESIVIPDGIVEIADSAFDSDYADTAGTLTSVSLPASLRKIGIFAFNCCESLETVTFRGDRARVGFADYAFDGTPVYDTLFPTPANDDFTAAAALSGESGTVRGTTSSATMEYDDHDDLLSGMWYYSYTEYDVESSVWYSWTAPKDGFVAFSASSTNGIDRTFAIGATTGYNSGNGYWMDSVRRSNGSIGFVASEGVTYYVSVGSWEADVTSGHTPGDFSLAWSMPSAPANDDFADAQTLPSTATGTFSGTTLAATTEDDEFLWDYDDVEATVWYKWTAPRSGVMKIESALDETEFLVGATIGRVTHSEDGDEWEEWSNLSIRWVYRYDYEEDVNSLTFKCVAGTTYYISVGQYQSDSGDFAFSWQILDPVANDNFADAAVISGAAGSVTGTNMGATREPFENEEVCDLGQSTVWWKWTAPTTDCYQFDTFGSRFDTMIAVLAEDDEEEFGYYCIAENDDARGSGYNESYVDFEAEAGQTYWIGVSGYSSNTGVIKLNWGKAVFELVISNGTLTGYRGPAPETLDLSETSVKAIADYAFSGSAITSVILPETLTRIGSQAFTYCTYLQSVAIPASVTYIGSEAFAYCSSLEVVTFDGEDGEDGIDMDRDSAFRNTPWLLGPFEMTVDEDGTLCVSGFVPEVVEIPEGTLAIPDYAFSGATRLSSVTIPASVETIGYQAFYSCTRLTSVTFEEREPVYDDDYVYFDSTLQIGDEAFRNCSIYSLDLPAHLAGVAGYAFCYNRTLTDVVFRANPDVVDGWLSIDNYAFSRCYSLSSVVFEDRPFDNWQQYGCGVEIYNYAFSDCTALAELALGSGVAYIYDCAFANCRSLEAVSFPASLDDVYPSAFSGCTALAAFDVDEGNQYYAAFDGILYNYSVEMSEEYDEDDNIVGFVTNAVYKSVIRCPEGMAGEVVLPRDTTGINDGAFANCTGLSSVSIPETLEGVIDEASVFDGCPAAIEYYAVPHITLTLDPGYDGAETLSKNVALDAINIGDIPWPTRPGYVFRGWWTEPGGEGWRVYEGTSVSDLDGIDTLYAYWVEIVYDWGYEVNSEGGATITSIFAYTLDGEDAYPSGHIEMPDVIDGRTVTALGSRLIEYNSQVTSVRLPAGLIPGQAGGMYAFYNLYSLETVYAPDPCAAYESDLRNYVFYGCPQSTVFEYFTPEYVKITLDAGDGAVLDASEVNALGTAGNLPVPTREGYDFMGWWTAPTGGEWISPNREVTADFTAYAHWQQSVYTWITQPYYDNNGVQIGVRITTGDWNVAVYDANGNYPAGAVVVPYAINGQPVVAIGYGAFLYCEDVTEVVLPPTVREISFYAFYGCSSLAEVSLPSSLQQIQNYAFSYCRSLAAVEIPASVTYIDGAAFSSCTSLDEFSVSEDNEYYTAIDGVLYTKDGTTLVSWPAGRGGAAEIAEGTKTVGSVAFYYANITSVYIPNGVERIEAYAFNSCANLATVDIPSSVTYIGSDAFAYSGLVAGGVTIGNSETYLEATAFRFTAYEASLPFSMTVSNGVVTGFTGGCPETIDIGKEVNGEPVTDIGYSAFDGYNHDMTPLRSVVVPEGVVNINNYAFRYCRNLETVSLPSTLQTIDYDAFYECYSLTNLVIPAGVESIGYEAFRYCQQLREITIPASVTNLGSYAFSYCPGLEVAYVPSALQSMVESRGVFSYGGNTEIRYYDGEAPEFATVTLDWNDGSGHTEELEFFQVFEDLPVPRKEGYSVEGWYLEPQCVNRVDNGDAAQDGITLYAKWTETVYEFSGYSDNGDGTVSLTYDYDYASESYMPCVSPIPYGRFEVPEEIDGMTVSRIGERAFINCDEMTEIFIPAGVSSFSYWAFSGCTSLTNIVVDENNATYSSRDGFLYDKAGETLILCPPGRGGDVIVPDGTKHIGQYAFRYNSLVTYVELSEGVESIGYDAFYGCTSLDYVYFPTTLRTIGSYAFYGCTAMEELDFPPTLRTVGDYAFQCCTEMKYIYFQDGLEEIGYGAFRECHSLRYVYLPEGLRTICPHAFAYCDSEYFTSVSFPSSIEFISDYAFYRCTSLEDVSFGELAEPFIEESAFDRTPWGEANYEFSLEIGSSGELYGYHGACPAELEIPASVRRIGNSAFNGCATLESLFIPASVTYISSGSFANCPNLTDVMLPSTLSASGYTEDWMRSNVFYGCPNVTFSYYHQVVFDLDGKGELADGELVQYLDNGEDAVEPSVTAKPGWRFVGWDRGFSSVRASIKVRALYESTVELVAETEATAGVEFLARLSVVGADDSLTWALAGGTEYTATTNSAAQFVAQGGTGLGLYDDDVYTSYELPFSFPFYGEEYTTAYPSSNGTLFFGNGSSAYYYQESLFMGNPMISGMWRDMYYGEVYVTEESGSVTFRWDSQYYSDASRTSMSITLHSDGRIVCSYGSGNATGGAVGISAGDGENYVLCSDGSSESSMGDFGEIVFAPSVDLPDGLTLAPDGVISGVPSEPGDYEFLVSLTDESGAVSIIPVTLRINDNSYEPPIVNAVSPVETAIEAFTGESLSFAVDATDPNGDELSYGWLVDSVAATASQPEFTMSFASAGSYTVVCRVSNSGWTINAAEWTISVGCRVTLEPNGGKFPSSGTDPVDVVVMGVIGELPVPTRAGYNFLGWQMEGGDYATEGTALLGDATFTAQWQEIEYTCSYTTNSDGTVTLTRLSPASGAVLVPATINGKTVSAIGSEVFYGASITEVVIPEGVTRIGLGAFTNCNLLKSVSLPHSLVQIGYEAFYDCSSLEEIEIPDGVVSIDGRAFAYCDALSSVTFGSALKSIGEDAFYSCNSLEEVEIPANVTDIGVQAFGGCLSLADILVSDGNEAYSSIDGILYDKYGEVLILCPAGKEGEIVIPDGTVVIDVEAFCDCDAISTVYIPETVEIIEELAFAYCDNLEEVYGLENISEDAYVAPNAFVQTPYESNQPFSVVIEGKTIIGMRGVAPVTLDLADYLDGASVTKIGASAFSSWNGIMSDNVRTLIIPEGIVEIAHEAFESCQSITSVTLPSTLRTIGYDAFWNCDALQTIRLPWDIASVSSSAFYECDNLTVEVPRRLENSLTLDYVTVTYYDNVIDGDVEYAGEASLPAEQLGVVSGSSITIAVAAEPTAQKLDELAGHFKVERGAEGQDAAFFKMTGKYDAATGCVVLKAEIDEDAVSLSDTVAEIMTTENQAAFDVGDQLVFENVVPGFYYGVAVAGSLDELAGISLSGVPLTKAGEGALSLGADKPAGGSAFFRVVISDREGE